LYKDIKKKMYNRDYLTGFFTNEFILLSKIFVFVLTSRLFLIINNSVPEFAIDESVQNQQPNIDAKSVYLTKTAVFGNNVKNLIILIPDKDHRGNGEPKVAGFIDQSFLHQKAIVTRGIRVMWFSGDISHEHNILVAGASNSVSHGAYDSGVLKEFAISNPAYFNAVGSYAYSNPEIDQEAEQKGFVMSGDIVVTDQTNKSVRSNASNTNNADTVGIYMVPTKKTGACISQLKDKGFSIDGTYSFKGVRDLARGTNSEQTLVVWTAGSDTGVGVVISALKETASTLPYK
jgi:hypothetical protein